MSAPRTADEFYRRGLALNDAGDARTALDHFLSAFRIAERPTSAISAANMHLKLGDRDRARTMYDRAKGMELTLSQEALIDSKLETLDAQARAAPLVATFLQEVRPDDPRLLNLRTMLSNVLNSEEEAKVNTSPLLPPYRFQPLQIRTKPKPCSLPLTLSLWFAHVPFQFRKVKELNPKVASLLEIGSARPLLEEIGFVGQTDESGDAALVLPQDAPLFTCRGVHYLLETSASPVVAAVVAPTRASDAQSPDTRARPASLDVRTSTAPRERRVPDASPASMPAPCITHASAGHEPSPSVPSADGGARTALNGHGNGAATSNGLAARVELPSSQSSSTPAAVARRVTLLEAAMRRMSDQSASSSAPSAAADGQPARPTSPPPNGVTPSASITAPAKDPLEMQFDSHLARAVSSGVLSEAEADLVTDAVARGADAVTRGAIMRDALGSLPEGPSSVPAAAPRPAVVAEAHTMDESEVMAVAAAVEAVEVARAAEAAELVEAIESLEAMLAAETQTTASPLPAATAAAARDLWSCEACTFENEGGATCTVCYSNRPGMWTCSVCQHLNRPSQDACCIAGCTGRNQQGNAQARTSATRLVCPRGCGATFGAVEGTTHEAVCQRMVVSCPWGCPDRVMRGELADHRVSCPDVLQTCPGCEMRIRRGDAAAHFATCAQLPVACFACELVCTRGALEAHLEVCPTLCPPEEPDDKVQCPLCLDEYDKDEVYQAWNHANEDGHFFCFQCAARNVSIQIDGLAEGEPPVLKCPHGGCETMLVMQEVQALNELTGEDEYGNPIRLGNNEFDKYVRCVGISSARSIGTTFCPGGCGWGAQLPRGHGQFLHCDGACNKWYCLSCQRHGIEGHRCDHGREITCQEHRTRINHGGIADRLSERYILAQTKPCPGCRVRVAKEPDWDDNNNYWHTCMKIRHRDCPNVWPMGATEPTYFCWSCLAPQRPILEHDNSFHKRECLYWQPPADVVYKQSCPGCRTSGKGLACNARPASNCTRESNGDLLEHAGHFCACVHGCPCDSEMHVDNECECGGTDANGEPLPSSECTCGRNKVICGACERTLCRLCGRSAHEGYKCIEDRLPTDEAPPHEEEEMLREPAASSSSGAAPSSHVQQGVGLGRLADLSTRELKQLIVRAGLSFHGCLDKADLLARATEAASRRCRTGDVCTGCQPDSDSDEDSDSGSDNQGIELS